MGELSHNESITLSSLFSTNSVLSTCMSDLATYSINSSAITGDSSYKKQALRMLSETSHCDATKEQWRGLKTLLISYSVKLFCMNVYKLKQDGI